MIFRRRRLQEARVLSGIGGRWSWHRRKSPKWAASLWAVCGPSVDHRLARLAAARGVSGRRGSRLPPQPERVTSRWVFRRASVGEVAGGPRFVRASVVMPPAEVVGAGSEAEGVLWIVCWEGWRGLQVCPGFVIVGLPKGAGVGSEALGCLVAGGSARFVQRCQKSRITGSRRGGFAGRGTGRGNSASIEQH